MNFGTLMFNPKDPSYCKYKIKGSDDKIKANLILLNDVNDIHFGETLLNTNENIKKYKLKGYILQGKDVEFEFISIHQSSLFSFTNKLNFT